MFQTVNPEICCSEVDKFYHSKEFLKLRFIIPWDLNAPIEMKMSRMKTRDPIWYTPSKFFPFCGLDVYIFYERPMCIGECNLFFFKIAWLNVIRTTAHHAAGTTRYCSDFHCAVAVPT